MKTIHVIGFGLAGLLFAGTAQASFYVGADFNKQSMTSDISTGGVSADVDYDYEPIKLKLGWGTVNDFSFEVFFQSAKPDRQVTGKDADPLNELGYTIRKAFEVGVPNLYPYLRGGANFGWQDLNLPPGTLASQDVILSYGFHAGLGLSYVLADQFELLGGLDYQYRAWQDIDIIGAGGSVSQSDTGTAVYFGVNYWFDGAAGNEDVY